MNDEATAPQSAELIPIPKLDLVAYAMEVENENRAVASLGSKISDDTEYRRAAAVRVRLRESVTAREQVLDATIKVLHQRHRALTAQRKALTDPIQNLILAIDKLMDDYDRVKQEQTERARQELARVQQQARSEMDQQAQALMEKGLVRHHCAASEIDVNDPVIKQYLGV